MKTNRFYLFSFFILAFGMVILSSCDKRATDDVTGDEPVPTGTVRFHLHSFIEDNEVDLYNIPYSTHEGRTISLSLAQLYISDVELVKLDGSVYRVPDSRILKIQDTDTYTIGDAPVGNYKSVRFKVGLPPASNHIDSAEPKDSVMWFSKTKPAEGYIFLNAQGSIDTSAVLDGSMAPFVYKIGTNINYKQVTLPEQNFTVVAGEVYYVHLLADFNKLFNGINLRNKANLSVETTDSNTSAVAQKIVNNIPSMFMYE